MFVKHSERGDTLVEVLLAIVILSIVATGAFAVMNKGAAVSYGVLERTETRSRVSQQLELLTYFRDQYALRVSSGGNTDTYPAAVWKTIRSKATSTAANSTAPTACSPNTNSFYIEQTGSTYKVTDFGAYNAPSTTPRPGDGLWIEAVASSPVDTQVPYIDLYVKACWDAVTGTEESISSTVRLYDR